MEHYIITALTFTPTQIFGFLWLFIIIAPIGIPIAVWIMHTNWLKKAEEKGRRTSGTVIERRLRSQGKHKEYQLFVSYTGDDGANHLASIYEDNDLKKVEVGQSLQIVYVPGRYKTIMLASDYQKQAGKE